MVHRTGRVTAAGHGIRYWRWRSRATTREQAKLRGRHGHRPAPSQRIIEPHHRPLEQRAIVDVERARAFDGKNGPELQVVLQVFADPGQRVNDRGADRLDEIRPADAGEFEELRRTDRAGRQYDFASRARLAALAVLGVSQPDSAAALEKNPLDMRAGRRTQVWPLENRLQKSGRRAPAPPAALVDFEIGRTFVVAAIEIVDFRDADLFPGVADRVQDRPGDARALKK